MSNFGFSSTTDDVLEPASTSPGRLAVVTGASTGLGEETTRALADHGAAVVMAVRDVGRGRGGGRAGAGRPSDHPVDLEVRELDLASLDSVRAFADGFLSRARPPRPADQQRRADGLPAGTTTATASSCSSAPTTSATSSSARC